jgi:hypothetical protein
MNGLPFGRKASTSGSRCDALSLFEGSYLQ